MEKKTISGIILTLLLMSVLVSNAIPVKGEPPTQPRVFRLLAIEQMFDSIRMQGAQFLIKELLKYPNWNNSTDEYVSYIHLLSLYNYSKVDNAVKPFWRGFLSYETIKDEIVNFLENASPGEIVILYYNGHSSIVYNPASGKPAYSAFLGVSPDKLRNWLNSTLAQACLTLILDTCWSGYWAAFSSRSTVLAASGKNQVAWGSWFGFPYEGDSGFFTVGLLEGLRMADESDGDGWLSVAEAFPYAKNFTETYVTWSHQNPESYYGVVEGDLPIIQRDVTKPFPKWDIAILSVHANPLKIDPETLVTIDVTVENQGVKHGKFDVTVYVNSSLISTKQIALLPGEAANVTFTWFPTEIYVPYVLSSIAGICPGEVDTSDNICYGPQMMVTFKADLNSDAKVDIRDLSMAALSFGSYPDHSRWNPIVDVNQDNKVDIKDMAMIAIHFGEKWTP